ncbi:hypothetical protein P691DRAFT_667328 [Macrolepiota fuliginosa MF-IS2]|uniref:Uncharacterized protein n=1 Tax=Macrolepiota fuliginosa MF-IS2 TaxID=1400762 RepID=A0A9P5XEG3_9AGAR|nr:hypothetical protein P691DRAFT_667328 [Macrolepiota fuliginosa MF-IS2]
MRLLGRRPSQTSSSRPKVISPARFSAPAHRVCIPGPAPPRQHLASTQDLLARFRLLPAYDKHVRPVATQYSHDGQIHSPPPPISLDKGKARELDPALPPSTPAHAPPATNMTVDGADADDDDGAGGKGEKKKKNTYKALIKGIPGKHSMKKDDYLTTMMLVPPKQRTRIHTFDLRTQQEAFAVSLEGLKGWNVTTLIPETAQAREDRKKRKEIKRLAKAQQAQAVAALQAGGTTATIATSPVVAQPQPIQAGAGGVAYRNASATPQIPQQPTATATPKPVGTPRPISTVPRPGSAVPRPGSAVPRPGSTAPQRPTSTAPPFSNVNVKQEPRPTMPLVQVPSAMVATPSRTSTATPTSADPSRGKKRERDDPSAGATPLNGIPSDSYANTNGVVNGMSKINAKAGVVGVRPRPVKKQRMDVQGQARDVSAPVQQPTPQGV